MSPLPTALCVTAVLLSVTCVQIALVEPAARRWGLPRSLDLIAAVATLALVGYALFWLYLFDPRVGVVVLATFWTVVLTLSLRRVRADARSRVHVDFVLPLVLTLSSAYLSLGLLFLFRSPEAAASIASNRFTLQQLPADNIIPQMFAERLLNGQSPRALTGDWLSSDRPPLATGWMLLFQQPLELTGTSRVSAFFVGAFTFQMSWVAGVWAVLRTSGFGRSAAATAVVFTACTSVTLINSVFTWPKLSAGAFTLAAWAVILGSRRMSRSRAATSAAFLALAMLSHGAAALAVVATVFVLGVECLRNRNREGVRIAAWGVAAGAALYAPWLAYQRWYEPPGDRLVKWHLAGVVPIDDRSAARTLVDVYRQLSVPEWLELRWSNTSVLFRGMFDVDRFVDPSVGVRTNEFFSLFSGIGLAGFCWLALPVLPVVLGRSAAAAECWAQCRRWFWLTIATLGVSILLLFGPSGTIIHQMPYVIPLSMTALPIAVVSALARRLGAILLSAQGVWFLATWFRPTTGAGGAISSGAVLLLVVASCVGALAVVLAPRGEPMRVGGTRSTDTAMDMIGREGSPTDR